MPFQTPSVSDFKTQFARDFPYAVPAFGAAGTLTIVAGVITDCALAAPGQGYLGAPTCAIKTKSGTGATITATIANGGVTAFTVGAGGTGYSPDDQLVVSGGAGDNTDLTRVVDADITGAIMDAGYNVNEALFDDQAQYSRAFLYLCAHCLVERLLAAGEGMRSRYNWLVNAKSAGDLSESFTIPENILQSAFLSAVSKTRYGAMYLQIITPLLVGNMATFFRRTPP